MESKTASNISQQTERETEEADEQKLVDVMKTQMYKAKTAYQRMDKLLSNWAIQNDMSKTRRMDTVQNQNVPMEEMENSQEQRKAVKEAGGICTASKDVVKYSQIIRKMCKYISTK